MNTPAEDPSDRIHRKRGWPKALALLTSVVIGLVLAEGILAFVGLPSDDLVFINKETEAWDCYCSNPRGYFVPRQSSDGTTIYCVDHSDDPPRVIDLFDAQNANKFKILTIGDSFTWGLGVKVKDGFPYLLGEDLAEATGVPVAVSNHGQVGRMIAEIHQEMRQALTAGVPDVCVYGFVLNDPLDNTVGRVFPVAPLEKAPGMDSADVDDGINIRTANLKKLRIESTGSRIRRFSRVLDLALSQWEWYRIQQATLAYYRDLYDPAKNGDALRVTWRMIAEMNQLQRQTGKHFLVVIFPLFIDVDKDYPFEAIHRLVARQLQSAGIDVLDLLDVYRAYPSESLWVHPLDRHPNDVAHRIAARAIRDEILRRGWMTPR